MPRNTPWSVDRQVPWVVLDVTAAKVATAEIQGRGMLEDAIDVARLIAAAPELLSALKQILRQANVEVDGIPPSGEQISIAYATARAAVATAEGAPDA